MKVLIAEDEMDIRQLLKVYLEARGHEVHCAHDGIEALELFAGVSPDLVLLDVRMPRMDGWNALKAIRAQSNVPVFMVTAMESADDAVKGLSLGADDYLRKPFDLGELEARIEAVQRRLGRDEAEPEHLLQAGPCVIDDRSKEVRINGIPVPLSPKEYALLWLLSQDPGRVYSTKEIVGHVWPESRHADAADVKQYIHLLRIKLEKGKNSGLKIETVKRFGYKLAILNGASD